MIAAALFVMAAVAPVMAGDTTLRLPRGGIVEVEAGFRHVTVTVGSGDQVIIDGAEAVLDGDRIEVEAMDFLGRRAGSPLRLTVPSWARVEVTVINGNLDVRRAPESLTAEVIDGTIVTRGGTGTMQLSTVTGAITVHDFAGRQLDVEAITGLIFVNGATGRIRAEAVNDPIMLHDIRSDAVDAATVNGRIEWSGPLTAAGRYRFESHNGNIELRLPPSVSARIHVSTFMGRFTSSLPVTTNGKGQDFNREEPGGQELTAVYGSGAAQVWVETFNGGIRVRPEGET
jgi:DUF4097 and DUF4098 domain-containing protein YvlB